MTSHKNLLVNGYEDVAEHVSHVVRKYRGVQALVVRDDGVVRMYPSFDRVKESDKPHIVGAYNKKVRVNEIEDDLILRLRELSR